MPPSDFAKADVDDIVEKLTTDEAILLTAGVGFWHTHEVPRLGIPAIKVRATILVTRPAAHSLLHRSAMDRMVSA